MYPVVLFTYNRLEHTQKVVESLLANKHASETKLYICSDAPRNEEDKPKVEACREYFKTIQGFLEVNVVALEENHNAKGSTLKMGNMLSDKYEAWIAVEDDAVVHPLFLEFMNSALDYYKDNPKVLVVNAYAHEQIFDKALVRRKYPYDIVFGVAFHSFAWATWSKKWKEIDFIMPEHGYFKGQGSKLSIYIRSWGHLMSHKVASKPASQLWDIHTVYYMLTHDMVAVWPVKGYVKNIGFDGSGLHGYDFAENIFGEELNPRNNVVFTDDIDLSKKYNLAIYTQVAIKWVKAFLGNFFKIIFSKVKILFNKDKSNT